MKNNALHLKKRASNRAFNGEHAQYEHHSTANHCTMRFAVYLPPQACEQTPVPVLYWLSGLTCTDENFMQKSGAMKAAAQLGIAIVAPDTSPRGEDVPDAGSGEYDLGQGAGFYLNANQSPWNKHYNMYSYITEELFAAVEANFPVNDKKSISGHSMGGHGALCIGLKLSHEFQSISAFAPICNPSKCPWGEKAFTNYLGDDQALWKEYDACELIARSNSHLPILIDQGSADSFLEQQLMPEALVKAAMQADYDISVNMHAGYDHSYYFISSFIDEHLAFHSQFLLPNK